MRRRLGWAIVVVALLTFGLSSYAGGRTSAGSQPLSGRVPGIASTAPRPILSHAGDRYRIVIEPSLAAGQPGWTDAITYSLYGRDLGGDGGGGYPTQSWPFFAGSGSFTIYSPGQAPRGDVVDYVLTGPEVAAVRFGKHTVLTFSDPRLPAGDRAAVFFRPAASPPVVLPAPGPPWPRRAIRLFALDSSGHVIPTHLPPAAPLQPVRFWQAPSAITPSIHEPPYHGPKHPLPGACELSQHGVAGLTPEFGHVIDRVRAVSDSQGEVFLSCIDTEYYLHGWPLEVSVLLDAGQPGQALGAIPGAQPVTGYENTVNLAVGQFPGSLTAQRIGTAWLVVQGGANLAQRLRVLKALRIRKLSP